MGEVGWYFDEAGRQAGPLGQAALVEQIRSARIAPGTRVWRPGLPAWAAWETLPELSSLVAPPLADPPLLPTPPAAAPPPFSGNSYAADVLSGAGAGALYLKAQLGGRFLAALVDLLITLPAALLWVFVVAAFTAGSTALGVVLSLAAVAGTLWALHYAFTKDGRPGGQSIGKKMMGLMVVHLQSNQPCSRNQSALRCLVMFLLNLVPYVGWLIEPIVLLAAAGGRRLGDAAAGTQVILASDHRPRR
jgi:uncharacterized RDD family membrane protein YckC